MAFGKKQLVLAALVVALGAAIYINWQFTDNQNLISTNTLTSAKELGEAAYVNNEISSQPATSTTVTTTTNSEVSQLTTTSSNSGQSAASTDYFNQAQLSRQKTRDQAVELLKEILESAKSSEQAKTTAIEQAAAIAKNIEQESNIENLIRAKGYQNCLVFIQNGESSVVVTCPNGLLESDAITVKDIVSGQAGIPYDKIKIVEAKY